MHFLALITLALFISITAASEIFYVLPNNSSNISCPSQPCYTLNQYLLDNGALLAVSNVEYHFMPGEHIVEQDIVMGNVSNLLIVGMSNDPLPVLRCLANVSIVAMHSQNITISDLKFRDCDGSTNTLTSRITKSYYNNRFIGSNLLLFATSHCEVQNVVFVGNGIIGIQLVGYIHIYNVTINLIAESSGLCTGISIVCQHSFNNTSIIAVHINKVFITGKGDTNISNWRRDVTYGLGIDIRIWQEWQCWITIKITNSSLRGIDFHVKSLIKFFIISHLQPNSFILIKNTSFEYNKGTFEYNKGNHATMIDSCIQANNTELSLIADFITIKI